MRNMKLEAAIWNRFTSTEFFEAAAIECEATMTWFGTLAISRQVANFGRNNQIFDTFKALARDFRRGAELAQLGDYRLIWDTARCVRGDIRGMLEQALHSWMTESEHREFEKVRLGRLRAYAGRINSALHNAMVGAEGYFTPNPEFPERRNDDDGFPGEEIVEWYNEYVDCFEEPFFWKLPEPLPEVAVDTSILCRTGDEVPWTGVWYPGTGLEQHSLTFAIKGNRMQAVYRVVKTTEELEAEGVVFATPQTIAVPTTWHPVKPSQALTNEELWAKEGECCPKAGIWQPTDPGAAQRIYAAGEMMASLNSAFGLTVWRWIADR